MSEVLESSWVLEARLKKIDCADNIKIEILKFIEKKYDSYSINGKKTSICNLVYRRNLHYLCDNINKKGLFSELQNYNNGIFF